MAKTLSSGHNVPAEATGLSRLLSLHGEIWEVGDGFWVKIDAKVVVPDEGRPHGIAYSLTLHSPAGERLIGFDNAHAVGEGSGPGRRIEMPFDHAHKRGRERPYVYSDANTLLDDFWTAVEDILKEEGVL